MKKFLILLTVASLGLMVAGNAMAWDFYMEVEADKAYDGRDFEYENDIVYGTGGLCYMQVEVEFLYAMPEESFTGGYAWMHTPNYAYEVFAELPYYYESFVSDSEYGGFPVLEYEVFAYVSPQEEYPCSLCHVRSAAMAYWVG